jgi:hypothetical protein
MKTTIRTSIAVVALAASAVLGISTVASAERVGTVSQGALKAGCSANGGNSYGNANAYGCTKSHPDGSSDTIECGRTSGCVHIHNDPEIRTGSGRPAGAVVTAAR